MSKRRQDAMGPNRARSVREVAERKRGQVRALRAYLKQGRIPCNEVLRRDKLYSQDLRLRLLLLSLPGIGPMRADWILETMHIDPELELGELPMLRREELIMLLARYFPWVPLSEMTPQQNRERLLALQYARMPRVARVAP